MSDDEDEDGHREGVCIKCGVVEGHQALWHI